MVVEEWSTGCRRKWVYAEGCQPLRTTGRELCSLYTPTKLFQFLLFSLWLRHTHTDQLRPCPHGPFFLLLFFFFLVFSNALPTSSLPPFLPQSYPSASLHLNPIPELIWPQNIYEMQQDTAHFVLSVPQCFCESLNNKFNWEEQGLRKKTIVYDFNQAPLGQDTPMCIFSQKNGHIRFGFKQKEEKKERGVG